MTSSFFALLLAAQTTPGIYVPQPVPIPGQLDAAATALAPRGRSAEFDACLDRAIDDPAAGSAAALDWIGRGGGWLARQCLGFAYSGARDFAAAADAFARAASEAEIAQPDRAAALWIQAGNAALAGNDAARATRHFDAALARGSLTAVALGEAHLDRARARVAAKDLAGAATDLARARVEAAADPLAWLLSATLARRQGDLVAAAGFIAEAATRAPRDAAVMLEAGNIAILSGNADAARRNWQAVLAAAPDGPEAHSARDNLSRLGPASEAPPQSR